MLFSYVRSFVGALHVLTLEYKNLLINFSASLLQRHARVTRSALNVWISRGNVILASSVRYCCSSVDKILCGISLLWGYFLNHQHVNFCRNGEYSRVKRRAEINLACTVDLVLLIFSMFIYTIYIFSRANSDRLTRRFDNCRSLWFDIFFRETCAESRNESLTRSRSFSFHVEFWQVACCL